MSQIRTHPAPGADVAKWSTRLDRIPIEERTPKTGDFFIADDWRAPLGYTLEDCDDWDGAQFRYDPFPTWRDGPRPAVNIDLTARVGYANLIGPAGYWFRCAITWPGDGDAGQFGYGWVLIYRPEHTFSDGHEHESWLPRTIAT